MLNDFLDKPINYKPETHAQTPYLKAQQEWDLRLGDSLVRAKNWRFAFISTLALSIILAFGFIVQSLKHQVVPVIIAIDKEKGEPRIIGKANVIDYQPQLAEITYFLSQFINNVRSVPSDPVVVKKQWQMAYAYLSAKASNQLNEMANNEQDAPLNQIGQKMVMVAVRSVVPVAGSQSYQIRWQETVYGHEGHSVNSYQMTGIFTITRKKPESEAQLLLNPLGLIITGFQWHKDL